MKYILVNQSCGPLFIDIVNLISNESELVCLFTGKINEVQVKLLTKVRVVKSIQYLRNSFITRFITWFLFTIHLFFFALFTKRNKTWLVTTNPPFAPWLFSIFKLKKSKWILLVYDIYPEVLSASRVVSTSNPLYRIWFLFTQNTYKQADKIICIGDSMAEYLITQNNELREKICVIPNWNIIDFKDNNTVSNSYRIKRNAINKIHIVYSGNIGATHDFDTILEVARALHDDKRFAFSIIGEGYKAGMIKRYISQYNLTNIIWETYKPPSEVYDVFMSADLFLITLGPGVEKSSIPSKTYDAIAAGAALIVIAPNGSELENLVNNGSVGKCFNLGETDNIVQWLFELADNSNLLIEYKKAANKLSKHFSPENAKRYAELLTTL